jgi:hypothetical protein
MHEQPKSLGRYVGIAAIIVTPLLYFISAHVDHKVVPVSGYVAQTYGVAPGDSKIARFDKADATR